MDLPLFSWLRSEIRGNRHSAPRLLGSLRLEWQLVPIRYFGIVLVSLALLRMHLPATQTSVAFGILVLAALYNSAVWWLLFNRPNFLASGYFTALTDALLSVAIMHVGREFDSPFHYMLFAVVISTAVRYAYGPALATACLLVLADGLGRDLAGKALDARFFARSGFLVMTAILAGYLREETNRVWRGREAHLHTVLQHVGEAIITIDGSGMISTFNPAAEQIFGYREAEVFGHPLSVLIPNALADEEEQPDPKLSLHGRLTNSGEHAQLEGRRKGGQRFPVTLDIVWTQLQTQQLGVVSVHDVTERRRWERLLEHQALHDSLTGLPNRSLLHDRLQQAILSASRAGTDFAFLLTDLDSFKEVNDSFGHECGDELLRQIGPRIRSTLRESDTVARLGGDEFALILPGCRDAEAASVAAGKIVSALERPFAVKERVLQVGVSIGIVLFGQPGTTARELMRRADVAMYKAKRAGEGYAMYEPGMDRGTASRVALTNQLRRAIEEGQLRLVYQPKVNLKTDQIVGVEALVRWEHPEQGLILPGDFLPQAEDSVVIHPFSRWVLDAALQQCSQWQRDGLDIWVSVNLSMRNLHDPNLAEVIGSLLRKWDVQPGQLRIEVTESRIMADPARARAVLYKLSELGIRLSIDDFGTGYSSLAYLKDLPVDELKIDKSFVTNMSSDENNAAIVRSTIDLAHNFALTVTAEGVEDEQSWQRLIALDCDVAQGYHLARPMPAEELQRWLLNRSPGPPARSAKQPAPRWKRTLAG